MSRARCLLFFEETRESALPRAGAGLAALALFVFVSWPVSAQERRLQGTVVAVETGVAIPGVRVVLDSARVWVTDVNGRFDFGTVEIGAHTLVFEHIAYSRSSMGFYWPGLDVPLLVRLEPREFVIDPIPVTAERTVPSLPVSSVSFGREATVLTPGTIANDPLRTVQSHPSTAQAGIDFLSSMAVRGGDTEEARAYFGPIPLRHAAHAGGFSAVVYDDMLASTVLVPGAAPLRFHGNLSGVIQFLPEWPDTSVVSLRYDITSMAAAVTRIHGPGLALQASAKASFFNLVVYQQPGVKSRSFRDVVARGVVRSGNVTVVPTVMLATDTEEGNYFSGTGRTRDVTSAIGAVEMQYRPSDWEFSFIPYYSYFKSDDALSWKGSERVHELNEARVLAEVSRPGHAVELRLWGEAGTITQTGSGGRMADTPFAGSGEVRLLYRESAALALGAGGSREEWTSVFEPEAYGSLRLSLAQRLVLSGAWRRSHQTPFLFNENRYFASIPVDAGDLASAVAPNTQVHAVQMDQTSASARLSLPLRFSVEGNGYWRAYDRLPEWEWSSSFPLPTNVRGTGTGRGEGYELILSRSDPKSISLMVAVSRSRVWKTEGTLSEERVGDFDLPQAWHAGASFPLPGNLRLSLRWMDLDGRPYTRYSRQTTPPPDGQVNALRLPRYQRFDFKLTLDVIRPAYHVTCFLDVINANNNRNVSTAYAIEVTPGEFSTADYSGTRFFPIVGITVRW